MMEDRLLDELYDLVALFYNRELAWQIIYDEAGVKLKEYHDLEEEAVNNNVQTQARTLEA